jgi:RNA-splicing ligase RtcB
MLNKQEVVDQIEVAENGCVQVRTRITIVEDGKQVTGSFHRHMVEPGQNYSGEDSRVQAVCAAMHTPEVIEAYKAAKAAQGV